VLVVGASANVRSLVQDVLSQAFPVNGMDTAEQVRELLEHAPSTEPAPVVVLLAANLSRGLELLRVLRPHRADADTPVLLMTEENEPLPRNGEALPDAVIRGRWERQDLLLRVRSLAALCLARHQAAENTHELLEARLAADRLKRAFETERATLRQVSKYVSPAVMDQLQNGGLLAPPSRQQVTVLFSDIRGFTDASAFATPEDLMDLLNDYLPEVNRIITAQGGNLDKFMGDGILAYFRASATVPDTAVRAVKSALRLLERLEELKVTWFERGFLPVGVGVGVTTGGAIMGTIGTGDRLDHTIIGPTVNLAARLQGLARGGEVVIDDATLKDVKHLVRVRDGKRVNVKGFEDPVAVYTVTSLEGHDQD
jgi:class 3 adenylate cyclase/CheY-like chemotaxis protein